MYKLHYIFFTINNSCYAVISYSKGNNNIIKKKMLQHGGIKFKKSITFKVDNNFMLVSTK